ncbi:hypothetical protein AB6A40_010005 [Gnathostoma spinigerum]|uniref:S-adenosylmethionine mitochondrial carrier protein n=1 Tax=Gnathostoma spinigerum TaxID=75299 RepID=A0ABD6EVC0_9BILA
MNDDLFGQGFAATGGFKHVYRGMSSVAVGSAPGSAIFFSVYTSVKNVIPMNSPIVNAFAASIADTAACVIRVPTELIKQRAQARSSNGVLKVAQQIYTNDGVRGFYRGFLSQISREVPFAFLEFPIWEALKERMSRNQDSPCSPLQSAACGSLAGSLAGGITTPLDVAKTRIMLNENDCYTAKRIVSGQCATSTVRQQE